MEAQQSEDRRVYQNYLIDSTRWDRIVQRPGDIVIVTPYKSGTTWMQNIVLHLVFGDLRPRVISDHSPWVEMRLAPIEAVVAQLEAQDHRRCLKCHLPRDGIALRKDSKYIIVGRDPRDVFMSLWNHYSSFTPEFIAAVNDTPGRVGPPLLPCPDTIRDLWNLWINRGWFDWETEGYPHWSNLRHMQSWWQERRQPNILFVHFNDLLAQLEGSIGRIAQFLEIDCAPKTRRGIAELVTFNRMKQDAELINPGAATVWKGGAKTFFNKGTNGRWRGVLTDGDLAMYDAAARRELSPDCRSWLESGRVSGQAPVG